MKETSVMYRLKPVYELPKNIDLPTCMYKLKNPVVCSTSCYDKNTSNESHNEVLNSIMDKTSVPDLASIEARWCSLIQQLSDLKTQMLDIRNSVRCACDLTGHTLVDKATLNNLKLFQGTVINANPSNPPYSLLFLKHLYKSSIPIILSCHTHSTLSSLPENLKCFSESQENNSCSDSLKLTLIWKNDILDTELVMNPVKQLPIKGEVNILRLFGRSGLKLLKYPLDDIFETIQIDSVLDLSHRLAHTKAPKERASLFKSMNAKLGKMPYFGGNELNISDISIWSVFKQINVNMNQDLSQSLVNWYKKMDNILF